MTIYYVDGAVGNDGNAGTSEGSGNAWATIDHAASTATSGDVIYIKSSATYAEQVTLDTDNVNANAMQFHGYDTTPGDNGVATITGSATRASCVTDAAVKKDNYVWFNLRFTNATGNGVDIGLCDSHLFYNCEFDTNGNDGVTMQQKCQFVRCSFHDNSQNGAEPQHQGTAFQFCCFYDNTQSHIKTGHSDIYRCLFWGQGIEYPSVWFESANASAAIIAHNVFNHNGVGNDVIQTDESEVMVIINNIILNGSRGIDDVSATTYSAGNLIYGYNIFNGQSIATVDTGPFWTDIGGNQTSTDPELTDPDNNDYTLQSTSPALNAALDIQGGNNTVNRSIGAFPASGTVDMGPYEGADVTAFMDGSFTEDEWWGRRRSLYRTNNNRGQHRTTARPEGE